MPEMLAKVAEIRRMLDKVHSSAWLEVDGGISTETITPARDAGADAFVAAHAIFHHPDGIAAGHPIVAGAIGIVIQHNSRAGKTKITASAVTLSCRIDELLKPS